jgi:hypothetical protein
MHAMPVNEGSTVLLAATTCSSSDKANKRTTRSTTVPTSLSTRRAPALAWYLGLAPIIILTTILIVNNAGYSPSLNISVRIATPAFDRLTESGGVLKYASHNNMSVAKSQQSLATEDALEEETAKFKKQLDSRPEIVIKPAAPEPERTCPDGSKGPSFTSLRVSTSSTFSI